MAKKKKITASNETIVKSKINKHVFHLLAPMMIEDQTRAPGWYYWDEVGLIGGGPYFTEKAAIHALNHYARHVLDDVPTHFLVGKNPEKFGGWELIQTFKSARRARQQYYQLSKKYPPDELLLLVPHPDPSNAMSENSMPAFANMALDQGNYEAIEKAQSPGPSSGFLEGVHAKKPKGRRAKTSTRKK